MFTKLDRFDVVRIERLYQPTPRLTELGRHQVSLVAKAAKAKPEVQRLQRGEVNHSCPIGPDGEFESTKGCLPRCDHESWDIPREFLLDLPECLPMKEIGFPWMGIRAHLFLGLDLGAPISIMLRRFTAVKLLISPRLIHQTSFCYPWVRSSWLKPSMLNVRGGLFAKIAHAWPKASTQAPWTNRDVARWC